MNSTPEEGETEIGKLPIGNVSWGLLLGQRISIWKYFCMQHTSYIYNCSNQQWERVSNVWSVINGIKFAWTRDKQLKKNLKIIIYIYILYVMSIKMRTNIYDQEQSPKHPENDPKPKPNPNQASAPVLVPFRTPFVIQL